MSAIQYVNQKLLLSWLEELEFKHYMCGQCQGIHITELQARDGVIESRLFLEEDCLIYTTELDVRNSALFAVSAELHKLNATYANLKLFVDVADDCPPRLVICDTQWMSAGLSIEQLEVFLQSAIDAKLEILELLSNCQFLDTVADYEENVPSSEFLH